MSTAGAEWLGSGQSAFDGMAQGFVLACPEPVEGLRNCSETWERPERLERSGRLIPFLRVSLAAPATRNSE